MTVLDITATTRVALTFYDTGKRCSLPFQPDDKWLLQIYDSNAIQSPTLTKATQIDECADLIDDHVDRRIQLFFMQAILCYDTPFHYEAEGAADQIGQGSRERDTQAAHSSTLPSLYAYVKKADGSVDRQKRFIFLKGGHVYKQHNATLELPVAVNKADTLIDGKKGGRGVRDIAIEIINDLAAKKFRPKAATQAFLERSVVHIRAKREALPDGDLRARVLTLYEERMADVLESIDQTDDLFDCLMGVSIAEGEKSDLLRTIVYERRYTLIRDVEHAQVQLSKTILAAQNTMCGTRKRSLASIDYRLRYLLLALSSGRTRIAIETIFCTSKEQLEVGMTKRQWSDIERFRVAHKGEIGTLLRDIRSHVADMQKRTLSYRAQLMRSLRTDYKGWRQVDFVSEFKTNHPNEAMSQSMVSRIERVGGNPLKLVYQTPQNQREKPMTLRKAECIAATYGIDVGLFLPALAGASV